MIILKGCPFCGNVAGRVNKQQYYDEYSVECLVCGAATKPYSTREQAVDAWNGRASTSSVCRLEMTKEEKVAYEWALKQNYGSVAAQYAKILAQYIATLRELNTPETKLEENKP